MLFCRIDRNYIEMRFSKSKQWIDEVQAILAGKKKLSLDDTVAFVKTGEKVRFVSIQRARNI